jgi:hypothetical protein
MKTTILTAILVLTSFSGVCKAEVNPLERDMVFNHIYQTVAHDLGLDTMDVRIKIWQSFEQKHMPTSNEPVASTQKSGKRSYTIYIYYQMEGARLTTVIIHELVHVAQIQSGRMLVGRRSIIFDGQEYTKDIPYNVRPFEVEAMNRAEELFNKYFHNEL